MKKNEKQAAAEIHSLFDKEDELIIVEIDEAERKRKINEKNRKMKLDRANKGLCIYCGKPVRPDHRSCQKCADGALRRHVAKKIKANPAYVYKPRASFSVVSYADRKLGYRTCWGCKQKVHKDKAYKLIAKQIKKNKTEVHLVTCSKECWDKYIDHQKEYVLKKYGKTYEEILDDAREKHEGEKVCLIIKEHDELLKDDPDRIDIKKYLRKHIECK